MKKTILFIALLFSFNLLKSQDKTITKQKFHFGTVQDTSAGYTQAIMVDNVIYISGTVSVDLTAEGIQRLYSTLERTLQYYGASFQNVVKENLYTTDIDTMKKLNSTRKAFYKGDFPAATWVQISRLFEPNVKLEVELIAHMPAK